MKIKRRTLTLWKRLLFVVFLVTAFSLAFRGYFFTQTFVITGYELVGVPETEKDLFTKKLEELASVKHYKIFPSNKVLTYSTGAIRFHTIEMFPNTESVLIRPVGLHTLRVTVKQFAPLFRIDETHAITKDGIIYEESRDMSILPLFTVASSTVRAVNNDGIITKEIVDLDKTMLPRLATLASKVSAVIFPVHAIAIDEFGDVTFLNDSGKSGIKFTKDANYTKVWSTLVSAIDTEPLKGKLENNKDMLEYLDVRFGNKVFYRFTGDKGDPSKGSSIVGTEESNATTSTTTLR